MAKRYASLAEAQSAALNEGDMMEDEATLLLTESDSGSSSSRQMEAAFESLSVSQNGCTIFFTYAFSGGGFTNSSGEAVTPPAPQMQR